MTYNVFSGTLNPAQSICYSKETHAPIANLPNSAQLQGTPCHSPKLHPGPRGSVGVWRGTDRCA